MFNDTFTIDDDDDDVDARGGGGGAGGDSGTSRIKRQMSWTIAVWSTWSSANVEEPPLDSADLMSLEYTDVTLLSRPGLEKLS